MPTVDVWNLDHEKVGTLELADDVFGQASRRDLVSDVVRCQMARIRAGSASTKTRAMVSGTGAKPFRQKRTGRARQGTWRSPHHRGGGVAFGPRPRKYTPKLSKKVRRIALRSLLSDQARENKLFVVREFDLQEIKTSKLAKAIAKFGLSKCLLVDSKDNNVLKLSARNLPRTAYLSVAGLSLLELMRYDALLISERSVKQLEGELKS
jgi:large subunit ribosomal protein L4